MSCPKLPTDKGNIKKFEITPNGGGNPVDISGSISQYYYYESIFDNSRRVVVKGQDAGYRGGQRAEDGSFFGEEGRYLQPHDRIEYWWRRASRNRN